MLFGKNKLKNARKRYAECKKLFFNAPKKASKSKKTRKTSNFATDTTTTSPKIPPRNLDKSLSLCYNGWGRKMNGRCPTLPTRTHAIAHRSHFPLPFPRNFSLFSPQDVSPFSSGCGAVDSARRLGACRHFPLLDFSNARKPLKTLTFSAVCLFKKPPTKCFDHRFDHLQKLT